MIRHKVSCCQKLNALNLCAQGCHTVDAAHNVGISESTIYSKEETVCFGDIEGGKKKNGRRAKFTPETINVHSSIPHSF
jgi:hypothetical protein